MNTLEEIFEAQGKKRWAVAGTTAKERIAKLFILIREYGQDAHVISAKKDIIEYIEIIKEIEKNLD